jgi:transmembrane sensor
MMSSNKQIEETAASWLARRDGGAWAADDQNALSAWLREATAHRIAFLRLQAAWSQADRLKALGAGVAAGEVPAPGAWGASPFFEDHLDRRDEEIADVDAAKEAAPVVRRRWPLALAASVVVCVIGVLGWVWLVPRGTVYATVVGGLEPVPLADGSTVTLNTDSVVRVVVTGGERRVDLERGEAYFEVAKDSQRPFKVRVGADEVIAVGTKFSVLREADSARIVMIEGRVRVDRRAWGVERHIGDLTAGMIGHAHSKDSSMLIENKPLGDAQDTLSWRSGMLVFRDTPLVDAVTEINRYNVQKIVVTDPAMGAVHIGGSFRVNNTDGFVRLLEKGFSIRAQRRGEQIELQSE